VNRLPVAGCSSSILVGSDYNNECFPCLALHLFEIRSNFHFSSASATGVGGPLGPRIQEGHIDNARALLTGEIEAMSRAKGKFTRCAQSGVCEQ
jgi:hypothetical protein